MDRKVRIVWLALAGAGFLAVSASSGEQSRPGSGAPAPGAPFRDVPPDHWAAGAVEHLRQRGILVGYPGGPGTGPAPAVRRTTPARRSRRLRR